jgi:hypothetical protein
MTNEQIEKSKAAVESAGHIPAEKKAQILDSLSKLRPAIVYLSETHADEAQRIARSVEESAHEATRTEKRPGALKKISRELEEAVEKFEASHPKLVEVVTEYSALLAEMGL